MELQLPAQRTTGFSCGSLTHSESPRVTVYPALARNEVPRAGEGARGGEPEVLPHGLMRPGGFEPPTNGLEGRRSSTELRAPGAEGTSGRLPALAGGGLGLSVCEPVAEDHLDGSGDGDGG